MNGMRMKRNGMKSNCWSRIVDEWIKTKRDTSRKNREWNVWPFCSSVYWCKRFVVFKIFKFKFESFVLKTNHWFIHSSCIHNIFLILYSNGTMSMFVCMNMSFVCLHIFCTCFECMILVCILTMKCVLYVFTSHNMN